jgi:death on curing protein
MKEPKRLTTRMILAIHEEAISQFGGSRSVRDEGLLGSALNKPRQHFAYVETASLFDLAASLCGGLAHNRPFLDGNKRSALLAARAFLFLNGWALEPEERDEVETMVTFATHGLGTEDMAAWFKKHSVRRHARK